MAATPSVKLCAIVVLCMFVVAASRDLLDHPQDADHRQDSAHDHHLPNDAAAKGDVVNIHQTAKAVSRVGKVRLGLGLNV
ncbi:hypothetical protein CCACVL1_16214 [Corchorus capsularis]|uniref:Uncharacterized protein n=1 Tax=Corchorus capsularis TaxID=210143 RepID=A0A1R3HYI0_COCAP|nr:hypothetical protein CCACVL1_16214 [Corchorus capsularis]